MRMPEGFIRWCLDHPTDNQVPGATWDQQCGSLVFRAGGFSTSATSAYRMALATEGYGHHLYSAAEIPFDEIPIGWFVYFDKAGPDNGHIGMVDGRDSFLSANWRSHPMTPRHLALGSMSISYYASISDRFMGASPYFINATLAGVSMTATTGITQLEEDDMYTQDDRERDVATRQLVDAIRAGVLDVESAVVGTRDKVPTPFDSDVNFGQSVLFGQQQERIAVQTILEAVTDLDGLADKIVAKLPMSSGGASKADIIDALKSLTFAAK